MVSCSPQTPRRYRVCVIAQTAHHVLDFSPYVPSIDDHGSVAFQARLREGGTAVFKASDEHDRLLALADEATFGPVFSHPDINRNGDVCFYAGVESGGQRVLRLRNGRKDVVADTESNFRAIGPLGPTMNDAGVVAFRATEQSGVSGIYCGAPGSPVRLIASTDGRFCRFHGLPVINGQGMVVFRADLRAGGEGVFADASGSVVSIVDTEGHFAEIGLFPSLNDHGAVAFAGRLRTGRPGVFLSQDGRISPVVDSSSGFEGFRGALVDNYGNVVFYATPPGGKMGIYSGPDVREDRILGIGDEFSDSTIVEFALNPVSVNAVGQFALRIRLGDGRQFICRVERGR